MQPRRDFRTCHRCGLDITTGEGERNSRWMGAQLPPDLDVYCDACRLTFFTCEAIRLGEHAIVPEHAVDSLSHVDNRRTRVASST
jgi:hypothetical protein